jgi:hypothetical protein
MQRRGLYHESEENGRMASRKIALSALLELRELFLGHRRPISKGDKPTGMIGWIARRDV